ncbi:MAG: hypothetical protein IBX44_08760 [Sulfurospirillum sp.]|nr:hypothetical protein [Sulfurospirillum sp.]
MTYLQWCKQHAQKHKILLEKLINLTDEQLIAYFDYDNMRQLEPDFCPLYAENTKCHAMKKLNCFLCACPHFRFDDDGIKKMRDKTLFSTCIISAKNSKVFVSEKALHQDCSNCFLPHTTGFIKKHFCRDWHAIMQKVSPYM